MSIGPDQLTIGIEIKMLVNEIKRLFIACATVFIFGCDAAETNSENLGVLDDSAAYVTTVSSYRFIYNDSPGVSISFSTGTLEECTITFAKKSLIEKKKLETLESEVGEIDLSCLSSGDLYMLDDTEKTYASMDIIKLNKSKAMVVVSGALYAVRSKKSTKINGIELFVTGENLENLLNK